MRYKEVAEKYRIAMEAYKDLAETLKRHNQQWIEHSEKLLILQQKTVIEANYWKERAHRAEHRLNITIQGLKPSLN